MVQLFSLPVKNRDFVKDSLAKLDKRFFSK